MACAFSIASGRWVAPVSQLAPLARPKQKLCVVPTTAAAPNQQAQILERNKYFEDDQSHVAIY